MADEGLVRYIKERLGEGYTEQQVRQVLRQHGNDERTVEEAFGAIHRLHGSHLAVPVILFFLVVIGVVLFFAFSKPDPVAPPVTPTQKTPDLQPASSVVAIAEQLSLQRQNKTAEEMYILTVGAAKSKADSVADGILLCSVNKEITFKNYCLQDLAVEERDAAYCDIVGDAKQRDDCYLGLILEGEDQYCAKLVLDESKKVCDVLLGRS